jgi:hypothetical protein
LFFLRSRIAPPAAVAAAPAAITATTAAALATGTPATALAAGSARTAALSAAALIFACHDWLAPSEFAWTRRSDSLRRRRVASDAAKCCFD